MDSLLTAQEHALITRASQSACQVRRFMQWDAAGGDDAVEVTRDHMIALGGGVEGVKSLPLLAMYRTLTYQINCAW